MSALMELRKLKGGKSESTHNSVAFIFLAPWLVGFLLITAIPLVTSLVLSFTNYRLTRKTSEFLGLGNYIRMFSDPNLLDSFRVTLTYVLVSTPLQLSLALLIAVVLNQGMKGLAFYRSVFYLPSLMGSSVAISLLWSQIFGSQGLVPTILAKLGLIETFDYSFIGDPKYSLITIMILHIWTFGSPMIIFLAGLRQIPTMYYEAASVDGASKWTQFWRITMPLLSPIIFFNLVLQVIGAFQSFTQAYIVSNGRGGPVNSTLFYSLYLYNMGFTNKFEMGYASAMAWFLVLIIAVFTGLTFWTSKYWVFYED
ncbi:MAG: sugar ABC transporter permease [Propionibacteriaceae bacterium]|jgi:multiple sugar transport system permease protein|nr:sugar ABC transporter permease [Propionibacteriaceae bacterium]